MPASKKPKIVTIVGPTASGKTALGIQIARHFDGEIISADSRQIYREMNVGTAKPPISLLPRMDMIWGMGPSHFSNLSSETQLQAQAFSEGIPHHLIDIRNPDQDYTVADFKRDATIAIDEILKSGKLPVVVGGTGLYIKSIVENLDIPEIKADPILRHKIENQIKDKGLNAVFEKLVELDPEAVYIVDPKNPRRVIRALEVAITTGKPFTAQRKKEEPRYEALQIGIKMAPEALRERINVRVDQMIHDGLLDEVRLLMKKYGAKHAAFDAIGYREIISALDGNCSFDAAEAAIRLNTWHFAKRQVTWFKKDKKIKWVTDNWEAVNLVEKFLR